MKIGKRGIKSFLELISKIENYQSIYHMYKVHDNFAHVLINELFSTGTYPKDLQLKTPNGFHRVRLYNYSDLSTLNLIFCRNDYLFPNDLRIIVDIGANIGLSCLYWLSRNSYSFDVYAYEPIPETFNKLEFNMTKFNDRIEAHQNAVSDCSGEIFMGVDESGVHSSINLLSTCKVKVKCMHIMEVLEPILTAHHKINVLKFDSEGEELKTLNAIDRRVWDQIDYINIDANAEKSRRIVPKEFKMSQRGSAVRFVRN